MDRRGVSAHTGLATAFWTAPREDHGGWCDGYRRSTEARHRTVLVEALRQLRPWRRLYEPGCHVGPNLLRIRQAFPDCVVQGSDVNNAVIQTAKGLFADDPNVAVWQADLFDDFNAPFFVKPDVILTSYTLAYVAPEDLVTILRRMVDETNYALVLAEPMAFQQEDAGRLPTAFPSWQHDYLHGLDQVLHERGRRGRITLLPVAPPVDHVNAVLTLEKGRLLAT